MALSYLPESWWETWRGCRRLPRGVLLIGGTGRQLDIEGDKCLRVSVYLHKVLRCLKGRLSPESVAFGDISRDGPCNEVTKVKIKTRKCFERLKAVSRNCSRDFRNEAW